MSGLSLEWHMPVWGVRPLHGNTSAPDVQLDFGVVPSWVVQALTLPVTSDRVRPSSLISGDGSFTVSELADRRFFQLVYGHGARFLMDSTSNRSWLAPG